MQDNDALTPPTPSPSSADRRTVMAVLRALQGVSQAEVARRAGLSPATVCRIEQGAGASIEARRRVAVALRVEPGLLFPDIAERGGDGRRDRRSTTRGG